MIKHDYSASTVNIQHYGHVFINYLMYLEKKFSPHRIESLCTYDTILDINALFIWKDTKEGDLFWRKVSRFNVNRFPRKKYKWLIFKLILFYTKKSSIFRYSKILNYD